MNKPNTIPFQNINWDSIPKTEHKGTSGTSFWQTVEFAGLRIRIVEYSKGYVADPPRRMPEGAYRALPGRGVCVGNGKRR